MTGLHESPDPLALYRQAVAKGVLQEDPHQLKAVHELQRVFLQLVAREQDRQTGKIGTLLRRWLRPQQPAIKGVYLWGSVGRGKTLLIDQFFQSLPIKRKLRLHFHRFMQMVHARLREAAGQRNPLVAVAARIADEAEVLCFDEFYVADIGDAMILANLLEALFDRGVVLLATSNLVPERLYENGLQRKKFLPAIALLHKHTVVLNLDGETDYRLRSLSMSAMYLTPPSVESAAKMAELFRSLTRGHDAQIDKQLDIQGRIVHCLREAGDVVWFEFSQLCRGPRGVADYVELADRYQTVLVSGVPAFRGEKDDDEARRFVALVDEFYDRRVKLVLEAEVPLAELYQGEALAFVFERTRSRLIEMQSESYLAAPHLPGG